jgi:hypothetical protein
MLTNGARVRRMVATIVVLGSLVAGTFWGQDDHFPVGPFRMYSVRNELDGRIKGARLSIEDATGEVRELPINPGTFGLRRAEIEGQVDRFEADPELLRHVATAYERFNPGAPDVVGVELFFEITQLRGGRPLGVVARETVATWSES